MNQEKLIFETSKIWCPDVSPDSPRQSSTAHKMQEKTESRYELTTNLLDASEAGNAGYVSTYSFPRGHTDNGDNIPKIDTIFVDFDIPQDSEYRTGESRTLDEWKRSMSDLLVRVRMVADQLLQSGKAKHWRASLSGHKGVHLFFDFEPVSPANGTYTQFKNGLKEYGNGMITQLDEIAGGINIDPWVDVDSSDLARLVRHPNTRHYGAKHADNRWCVPVTIEELASMKPDKYLEYTSGPREVPFDGRNPSSEARREIGVKIANASGSGDYSSRKTSYKDPRKVEAYKKKSNDRISVSDIPILVANKPCIMEFVERNDGFQHGSASRTMEINVIKELIKEENRVPIDVIINFFRPIDGFDEGYTRELVEDLISRYDGPFVCKNIWRSAPQFCVAMNDGHCGIYDPEQANS